MRREVSLTSIRPENFVSHAALNPFPLSLASMRRRIEERSKKESGNVVDVNHPSTSAMITKQVASESGHEGHEKDQKTDLPENRRGVSLLPVIGDDVVAGWWRLIGPHRSGVQGAIDQRRH